MLDVGALKAAAYDVPPAQVMHMDEVRVVAMLQHRLELARLAHADLYARVMSVMEVRASMGLEAAPKGVWLTRIGHAPEWQPTEPSPVGARCAYCHTLALDGSRCPSCGAPR